MNRRTLTQWNPARPGGWLTLRRYILLEILILLLAFLAGHYRETLSDDGGTCVHFESFMVCTAGAATDHVLDGSSDAVLRGGN